MQIREERVVREDGSVSYAYFGDFKVTIPGLPDVEFHDVDLGVYGNRIDLAAQAATRRVLAETPICLSL